jgi:hypothetical protein
MTTATVLDEHLGYTPLFASTWCSSTGSSGQVKVSWADGSGVSSNWSILFSPPTTWQLAVRRWRSHKALIIWQELLLLLQNSFLLGSLSCSLSLSTLLQNTHRTSFAACPDALLLRILTLWIIQYVSPTATFRTAEYNVIFWGDRMCLYGLKFQHLGDFLCFHYRVLNYATDLYVAYMQADHLCRPSFGIRQQLAQSGSCTSDWDHSQVWLAKKSWNTHHISPWWWRQGQSPKCFNL